MRDLPPLPDMDAPSPRPSGGPGVLVPAVVALLEDGTLELKPTEGSTAEEREVIGRICLCRWMYVEPRALDPLFEKISVATQQ